MKGEDLHILLIPGDQPAGEVPQELLAVTWRNLLMDFNEGMGNADYRVYVTVLREISSIRLQLERIRQCIAALRMPPTKQYNYWAKELNAELRISCKFNPLDPATTKAEIDKCERRTAGIQMHHDLTEMKFNGIRKKFEDQDKKKKSTPDDVDEYFESMLMNLSDSAHFEIPNTIMTSQFIIRVKAFKLKIATLKNKSKR